MEAHLKLTTVDDSVNGPFTLISTGRKQRRPRLWVTCALASLLRERGLKQGELARLTGISTENIGRLKNRQVVRRINCETAVKICTVLASVPRTQDNRTVAVWFDALFPRKNK